MTMFGNDMMGMMGGDGGLSGKSGNERQRVGVYLATITDIKDPEGVGRVKCKFITADEEMEEAETEWAFVSTPFAGNESGVFFHPHVGDVVLLAFEEGDIHSPFVVGSLWWKNSKVEIKAPVELAGDNEKNTTYLIKTPQGNTITLSDESGKEMIEVKTKGGAVLKLDDGGNKIEMLSSGGEGITLDTQQGALSIKCKKFELDVNGNKLTIDQSGATLDCKPSVKISSAQVTVEGTGTSTVKGALLNLESSGATTVKGSVVKLG